MSNEFTAFLEERGITRETSAPRTPQQNGVAERMNQTLIGGARSMLHHAGMTKGFWSEAILTATHVLNRSPRKGLGWRTPYELLFGTTPDVSHFRIFGCRAWVLNEDVKKWEPRANPMVFIGYEPGSKAFKLWDPKTRSIKISVKVRFDETVLPNRPAIQPPQPVASTSTLPPPEPTTVEFPVFDESPTRTTEPHETPEVVPSSPESSPPESIHSLPAPEIVVTAPTPDNMPPPSLPPPPPIEPPTPPASEPATPSVQPRRSERVKKPVKRYLNYTAGFRKPEENAKTEGDLIDRAYQDAVELYMAANQPEDPRTYREAITGPDKEHWDKAMAEEFQSLNDHDVWEVVKRPKGRRTITSKWVYRIKYKSDGSVERYKARLVARGFTQVYGVDYSETYAPVTRLESLRLMLAMAVENNWEARQIDVKTAYLYGELDEEVYMEPPEGFVLGDDEVLRLRKAIYGLKQAGRQWYLQLKEKLAKFGLCQIPSEPHTFIVHKVINGIKKTLILPVYVDDLFPIGDKELVDEFEQWIGEYFETTTPVDIHYFLGIRAQRERTTGEYAAWLCLDQRKYVNEITEKAAETLGPLKAHKKPLPSKKLEPSPEDQVADPETVRQYQSHIGQLMYVMMGTRPDIAYAIGKLARYSKNPSPEHIAAVRRVFGYLHGSAASGLGFQNSKNKKPLTAYLDSDWAREEATTKSTSSYCFMMADACISWSSKRQEIVAKSTFEAEYIALFHAGNQALWISQVLEQLGFPLEAPLDIKCDNEAAITVANGGPMTFGKSKTMNVKYKAVQGHVERNEYAVSKITSINNLADQFTKSLPSNRFEELANELGMFDLDSLWDK